MNRTRSVERLKYEGPIEAGMIFTAPDSDGEPLRRIRVLAAHPDGGWIFQEMPSRMNKTGHRELGSCPDFNLRYVFAPEAV